jgi:phosphoglycerate kinase
MKSIREVDVRDKIILLREDLNSEVVNGKVLMAPRIRESAKSIKFLIDKGAKVVVIAHQGRPGEKDFTSMKQHAKLLRKFVKIKFVNDVIGEKAEKKIKGLKSGRAILLDNIRGLKEEFDLKDNDFVTKLSSWCQIYVNDAFSVSHRAQASIVSFPKKMESYAGPMLEDEVNALQKINLKNTLYILAGAKPADNMRLMNKKNKVLACGLFGQMCIVAKGKDLGAQTKYLQNNISDYDKSLKELKKKLKSSGKLIHTPQDFAVRDDAGKRKDIPLKEFPVEYEIFDIGPVTQERYIEEIKKAKSIYMKGPAGYYSEDQFILGTKAILGAVAESGAFSVLGGGQLSDAIAKSGIPEDRFGHISLSGGALLDYIAGERLPGLEILGFYKKGKK